MVDEALREAKGEMGGNWGYTLPQWKSSLFKDSIEKHRNSDDGE